MAFTKGPSGAVLFRQEAVPQEGNPVMLCVVNLTLLLGRYEPLRLKRIEEPFDPPRPQRAPHLAAQRFTRRDVQIESRV